MADGYNGVNTTLQAFSIHDLKVNRNLEPMPKISGCCVDPI
jgi:hypothetical protein